MTDWTPFESSYIETALWSSMDDAGTPLDSGTYTDVEFSDDAIKAIKDDCARFIEIAADVLDPDSTEYPIAHDFWLARNRHVAGFCDGDYPKEIGKRLTDIAHSFGECYIYLGDDGKFYIG